MISEWIKSKFQLNPQPPAKPKRKTEYMYMGDGMIEEVYVDEDEPISQPSTYELNGRNYHGRREVTPVNSVPIIVSTSYDGGSYDSGSSCDSSSSSSSSSSSCD